jgi:hypothetical protein
MNLKEAATDETRDQGFLPWLGRHADQVAAAVAGVGALVAALASSAIRSGGREVLFIAAGLDVAVLGVVLAALAVVVVFLGDEYLIVLDTEDPGLKGTLRPYIVVAIVSGGATLVALVAAFLYPVALSRFQAVLLAGTIASLAASIVGVVQVVEITAFHGRMRAELLHAMRETERERQKRMRDSA